MAVVGLAKEVHQGRSGSLDASGNGACTRCFRVTTDDPENDDIFVVLQAPGLPQLYDTHPFTPLFTVNKVSGDLIATPGNAWLIKVEYSTQTPSEQQEDENPLNKPVDISVRPLIGSIAVTEDRDGAAIVNTATAPFDPPLERQQSNFVLTFIRNEPVFDPATAVDYTDKVNSATFYGVAAGYWKCNGISADSEFQKGLKYWVVTYEFEYNRLGWQPRVLNAGWEQLVSGVREKITDSLGRDIAQPWPLASNGTAIPEDDVDTDAYFLSFNVYEAADFNSLGL